MKIFFKEINKCPLCSSKSYAEYSKTYSNRYSEQIAKYLKISEDDLINKIYNVKCKNCDLIYKKNWFKNSFLIKLYCKIIPTDPKGWDTISKRFSSKNFLKEVKIYLKKKKNEINNKYKRSIYCIVDSINVTSGSNFDLKNRYLKAIIDDNYFYIKKKLIIISKLIDQPQEYKRFSNFNNKNLFKYITKNIKEFNIYSEIGCPLWGMYPQATLFKKEILHFKSNPGEFWNSHCKKSGISCLQKCKKLNPIKIKNIIKTKVDYLGVYLYLDHVENIRVFLNKVFKYSKNVGIILESHNDKSKLGTGGAAIQHFTLWESKTLRFVANLFGRKLLLNYKKINKSGNRFYLFKH